MKYPVHGWHWWRGVGNVKHENGHKITFEDWHVVRTWTVQTRVYASAACWIAPLPADQMGGKWGPQALPPSAAPTNALPWEVEVQQRKENKELIWITCGAFRLESEADTYAEQWRGMAEVKVNQRTPETPDMKGIRKGLRTLRDKIRPQSRADAQKLADAEAVLLHYLTLDATTPEG